MRILHIHPSMQGGGIEAMICGLANEMSKTEDVTVCSIFKPLESDVFWNKLSSRVTKISFDKSKAGFSLKPIFQAYWLIKKGQYDVVNIHGFFYYFFLSVFLLHRRVLFLYTIHSDARMESNSRDQKILFLKKRAFKREYIYPITISKTSRRSFYDLYRIDSELIENGAARPRINPEDSTLMEYRYHQCTKLFLHPGRITLAKNQITLCKVFSRLICEGNDIVLLIAGSVQDKLIFEEIQKYLSDRIVYLGERCDIPQLLYNVDVFCLPSIWEGLPVTLLESLSVGCIPICSPVGGIVDVVLDGENGLLSKSSSEDDYYNAVVRYLNMSEEERMTMKQKVINSFDEYDIQNTAKRYLAYYRQMI